VSTHINVVLHSFPFGDNKKRLMNDVHANKYSYVSLVRCVATM